MRYQTLLTIGCAALLAACNQPAATPEAPADPIVEAPSSLDMTVTDLPEDRSTAEQKAQMEAEAAAAGVPVTRQMRGNWTCDNDETVEVRFFPDQGIAVLVRGGQNLEMQQEPTADGFRYVSGPTSIQGKGNEFTMQVGMMAPTQCVPA